LRFSYFHHSYPPQLVGNSGALKWQPDTQHALALPPFHAARFLSRMAVVRAFTSSGPVFSNSL
jgi:hypothetical protein